jgi:hypothetical protein
MALTLVRPNKVYGDGGRIPVGKSKFYKDFVEHDGEKTVSGTDNVPRLKPVELGPHTTAFFDDEIDALCEGLRRERDEKFASPIERTALSTDPARRSAAAALPPRPSPIRKPKAKAKMEREATTI